MTFIYKGVHGPDVSFYQDNNATPQQIDYRKMKAAGASFVIIRAGQNNWPDPDFSYNYTEAHKQGLPRGVYWFYDSRVSPASQAALCLALFDPGDYPELGIWADFEENYNGQYKGWQNWKIFLNAIRAKTNGVIGVYTAPAYWMRNRPTGSGDLSFFKSFPLWIAHYDVNEPIIPGPWEYAIFWQIGTPPVGELYGVESKEIDMNYWHGSPESFRAYFGLGVTPPEEGTAMRYEAISVYPMSLRPDHNTNNTKYTTIPAQSKMQSDTAPWEAPGEQWLYVTHINGVQLPQAGWVAIVNAYRVYCTFKDNGGTPPPPVELPNRFALSADGVTWKWYVAE